MRISPKKGDSSLFRAIQPFVNKQVLDKVKNMKIALRIKEEFSDGESEYSSDISSNSNSNSVNLGSGQVVSIGENSITVPFTSFDGVHTGVPTRTTPTLTPTTLRNIEQTFIELTRETERTEPHQNEAGFVPPVVQPLTQGKSSFISLVDSKAWIGGSTTITTTNNQSSPMSRPTVVNSAVTMPLVQQTVQPTRRNVGGRRPTKNSGISPEEEERRRIRRERNKLAAARCRKRRLDHTNELQKETDGLEQKKQSLQNEIQSLQNEKEHLEFLLEAHKACCRLAGTDAPPSPPDIKPVIFTDDSPSSPDMKPVIFTDDEQKVIIQHENSVIAPSSQPSPPKNPLLADLPTSAASKPSRPSSLPFSPFPSKTAPNQTIPDDIGIPISTPSSGIPLNFDSLMDGGTGLTPVSCTGLTPVSCTGLSPISCAGLSPVIPSCSSQQRNSTGIDLSSPDTSLPSKLVSL